MASAAAPSIGASAMIFYLKNRAGWRDRQDITADVTADVSVDVDLDTALQTLKDAGIDPSKL